MKKPVATIATTKIHEEDKENGIATKKAEEV